EFSFRQGQLLCIGPARPDVSLGERLLQAGVISQEAYQEVVFTLGPERYREIGVALALIDFGHINQEGLYCWAFNQASQVIEALLTWTGGEIYFEENLQPPSDRLLIALLISSLLPERSAEALAQHVNVGAAAASVQQSPTVSALESAIPDAPTMHGTSTFVDASLAPSLFPSLSPMTEMERNTDALAKSAVDVGSPLPPQRVIAPVSPIRVNTAYMHPQMVLTPVDLSAYREQNLQVQLTPEQWRLFTCADGQTTLHMATQELGMSREQVCQIAGELLALSLVALSLPTYGTVNELSPVSREYIWAGLSNGMLTPGFAASPSQPWDAVMPAADPHGQFAAPYPIETHSQWGNGGNGATFVLGNGWVVATSPAQSSQPQAMGDQYAADNRIYAKAG
ncbi:MAG TPA: hypothetical protein VKR83_15000, partial [Ktedonobacteraceae bacterium]|nr:hypothetical protein [Ktedonobacteraceae bacterium]